MVRGTGAGGSALPEVACFPATNPVTLGTIRSCSSSGTNERFIVDGETRYSPSEMDGGGLSGTTAVVWSETGSAAIGPVALTLSAEYKV